MYNNAYYSVNIDNYSSLLYNIFVKAKEKGEILYSVIIIDDEPWVTIDIEQSFRLKEVGFHIIGSFRNPTTALFEILRYKPDLIITDIRMPHISGLELIKKIREQGLNSEIIIVSGYSDFEYAKDAIRLGAADYCLKPINPEEASIAIMKVKEKLDKKYSAASNKCPDEQNSFQIDSFHQLLYYVESHFYNKLTLKELAQKFHMNPNYCCSLFKKYKNTTFSQYLTNIRVDEAQKLLSETDHSLDKIASLVGFHDYFYFSKVFKKSCGISPKDYRKKIRG